MMFVNDFYIGGEPKTRIIQELVPGKQITLAHVIANPDKILYTKLGLDPKTDYSRSAIGVLTISPAESAVIAAADALGYAEGTYDVAISFVPVGADGSYDYSVIFSDSEMFSIDGSLVMDLAIPLFHYEDFKVEPTVSGYWTFYTSDYSFDVYGELYDD